MRDLTTVVFQPNQQRSLIRACWKGIDCDTHITPTIDVINHPVLWETIDRNIILRNLGAFLGTLLFLCVAGGTKKQKQ